MNTKRIIGAAMAFILCVCTCGMNTIGAAAAENRQDTGESTQETAQDAARPDFTLRKRFMQVSDGFYVIASGTCESILLTNDYAARNPALDAALAGYNETLSRQADEQFSQISAASKKVWDTLAEKSYSFSSGELTYELDPVRSDGSFLSFFETCTAFSTNAEHAVVLLKGLNFDTASGKQLALADIFADPRQLPAAIAAQLKSADGKTEVPNAADLIAAHYEKDFEALAWAIDRGGVTFRFAPGELAGFEAGMLTSRISFTEYPKMFTGRFTAGTGAYVRPLNTFEPVQIDLDGDGIEETLSVKGDMQTADANVYTGFTVSVGEKTCTVEDDFYSVTPMLLHTDDGRSYIYAVTTSDNDYNSLIVVDLTGGTPKKAGILPGAGYTEIYCSVSDNSAENYIEIYPMLEPAHFALMSRMDLMSTYSAMRYYSVGSDGMPVPLTDYYTVPNEIPLTCKHVLECKVVDPNTNLLTGDTTTIMAGMTCWICRTNGVDTVDLRLPDGTIVRVEIGLSAGAWPQTVNGIILEEAFDGTLFGG